MRTDAFMPAEPSCGTCRYFDKDYALCRRYAPKPRVGYETGVSSEWAEVDPNHDWCGEWSEKF